ncbi:RHTO0S18e03334g1_1, partial [Rhodotorula toruloides]
ILPAFHHLPKVHKTPLKGRPIVPSYAWITSNLSRYIDSLLQPLVRSYSWILRDSKHLLRELAKLQLPLHEEIWLITADIQSMYTNLPTTEGIDIMNWLGREHYQSKDIGNFIGEATSFVLENNYLSFQDQVYHQTDGTAMGTSMAPTYANLFVAAFEDQFKIPYLDNLLYYGRYIDDVLAIVHGSKEKALKVVEHLNALHPKLQFDAEISDRAIPFLDIHLYLRKDTVTPGKVTLHTKVYQKPLNAYQYIPWSSYHPESVKLAFIKGELTRYIRISSSYSDYLRVAQLFWKRLRRRGYPVRWLRRAFKMVTYHSQRAVSVVDRAKGDTTRSPLVYHIEYNPVWDFVNGSKVLTHTVKHWKPHYHKLIGTKSNRIMRAVHRCRNLSDYMNTWNKELLAHKG